MVTLFVESYLEEFREDHPDAAQHTLQQMMEQAFKEATPQERQVPKGVTLTRILRIFEPVKDSPI